MRGWSRSVFSAARILAVVLVLAGCGVGSGEPSGMPALEETTAPAKIEPTRITVASDMTYPPFEFKKNGKPRGFDVDLMDEIADRANLDVKYENVRFDVIIRGLDTDLYDASISAMTITDAREQQALFSDPYFNADQALLVESDSGVESPEDLTEETVGVQLGTPGQADAEELRDAGDVEEVRTFETIRDAFAALEDGLVEAVIYDLSAAQRRVDGSDGALEVIEVIPTGEQYGIAFPQDSKLVEPVNEALAEIKEDGTYEKIYKKWIGRPPEEIP